MTEIKKNIVLPYTSTQIYDLVNDLERYPEFISWCKGVSIHSQTSYKTTASIQASKFGMDFTFSIIYQPEPSKMIRIHLLNNGPFRSIEALWRFKTLTNHETQLGFEVQYELSNRLFGWTITPLLKNEINHLLKDFSARAEKQYGAKQQGSNQ